MSAETLARDIRALAIAPDRPLLVVDADEVLVHFAEHFAEFLLARGWRLCLTEYRLDGAIEEIATGFRAGKDQGHALIADFFASETRVQRAIPGAADTLADLATRAGIVILTNVPGFARADRVANLAALGMGYPVLVNEGGKGRAIAELARRTPNRVAFIDDSPVQIASAARYAPTVRRLHFAGSAMVRAIMGPVPEAQDSPADWPGIAAALGRAWDL